MKATKTINFRNDREFKKESKFFPNDHFACEWTGKILVDDEGKYTFYTRSDDGSRLWINGKQIVDNWGLHGAREKRGTVELKSGWHDFKATHFENAGGASMIVSWSGPDTNFRKTLLPGSHDGKIEQEKEGPNEDKFTDGFKAEYYFFNHRTNHRGYKIDGKIADITKATKTINFRNDHEFKKEGKNFPNDHFACQWSGKIMIENTGKYYFYTRSDDGSRLWINNNKIVENWGLHGARERRGAVELKHGWHDFRALHFENGGGASMIVSYQGPDTHNKKKLLEGDHDGKIEQPKPLESFEKGFQANYFFFNHGTGQGGYKTDGKKPDLTKTTNVINFRNDHAFKRESKKFPNDHFACEWTGKILIDETGKYNFFTSSDDGSRLWINGKQVVNNWGLHGRRQRRGTVKLEAGWHDFKATHFENAGGASMIVHW